MCLPEQAISNCKGNAVFKFIIYIYSFVALLLYIVTATKRNFPLDLFIEIVGNGISTTLHLKIFGGVGMPPHLP